MEQERVIPKEALDLEVKYYDTRKSIESLEKENRERMLKLILAFHGVKAGDLVKCTTQRGHVGEIFRISSFETVGDWSHYHRTAKPWIKGYRQKKDGTFETRAILIYSEWVKIDG